MSLPYPKPTNILYTVGVLIVGLFVLALIWFGIYSVYVPLSSAITTSLSPYDIANTTYQSYELADVFMDNVFTYILVIAGIGLLYWAFLHEQRGSAGYQ